ncbi:uncharacterized protein LOC123682243 [Harmonia axyridis]|uniref:uncharacterized protein LOC123682243 n=1 Tax=Harmonia axyridis TaxID=115357 RepID=UPI001E278F74|nr:uncharacterized protein LOC123682243 [Harmonia axyridis]
MSGVIIRRNSFPTYESVKCDLPKTSVPEYSSSEAKKTNKHSYPLPQIAIKKTKNGQIVDGLQIGLLNGCWDTSEKIPSIVAEMYGQNCNLDGKSEDSEVSNSGSDQPNENLSWLLDYKFRDLVPFPEKKTM